MCGDCADYADCCCDSGGCCCGESKFVLSAVSSVVGMLFVGILAILYSIVYLSDALDFTIIYSNFDYMFLCVGGVLTLIGIVALKAGDLTEGIIFTIIGLAAFVMSYGALFLGLGIDPILGWLVALVLLLAGFILIAGRDITFGIAVLLLDLGLVVSVAFAGTDVVGMVSGLAFLFGGIVFLYIAISDWLFVETGADLPIL
ncbi:MAG: hypothetical protein LBV13_01070 [Methanomassiliicoccaceae archaeon]|jgi:hypothetical protein|nr:hypothetical protein [Methanomassiliicoccaceae archaeon]